MQHKVGIYVRVSTEEQAQVADGSIESQQHRINGFVEIKKLQDHSWGKVVDTYIDDGYSAKSTNRPAYQRMIHDLKNGKINLILVTDLSRLSRNVADFCDLYKDIGKYKANFLSIKEQFDTSTPIGEMMVFNMINLAQFERKQTSERISMNFHSRALRGLVNGGNPLLGYDRDPTNPGKRIVNEHEAQLVKQIFDLYNDGYSLSAIAEKLTTDQAKRKDWGSLKHRHIIDGRWTVKGLQTILKNYAFIGLREVNGRNKKEEQKYLKAWQQYQLVPASWPAIIDEKLFYKIQKRLEVSGQLERQRFDKGDRRVYLVSGMIACGHCGRALIGQSAHGKNQVHRYYGHKQLVTETISCPIKRFSANEIEEAVISHLDKVISESGHMDKIETNIEKSMGSDKKAIMSKKASLEKSIDRLKTEIEGVFRLAGAFTSDTAGSELVQEKLQALAMKKKTLEKEKEEVEQAERNVALITRSKLVIEANILALKKGIRKAAPSLQKKLFSNLFNKLILTENGISIFYSLSDDAKNDGSSRNKKGPSEKSDGPFFNFRQPCGVLASHGSPIVSLGGDKQDRTADLLHAMQALSQLSYTPKLKIFFRYITY